MANLLRRHGHTVFGDHDNEIPIQCEPDAPPYYLDICALLGQGVIIVEIDGYAGHKSKRAIRKDKHRTTAIIKYFRAQGLTAKVYRFAFWQLTPFNKQTEELIAKELELVQDQTQGRDHPAGIGMHQSPGEEGRGHAS